jgi:beta-xylosidase
MGIIASISYLSFLPRIQKTKMTIMKTRNILILLFVLASMSGFAQKGTTNNITKVTNPMIWADVPDPDVIRVGDTFYMVSTTMHLMPGAPVMQSKDLVHWEIASYVFDKLTDTPKYDMKDGTVYGRGQWATSIRYRDGHFYIVFSPNDQPFKSYFYTATDAKGPWKLIARPQHFHDNSLLLDDDGKAYIYSGTGQITELMSDLSGVKKDGINMKLFDRDSTETGLLEGSRAIKHDGKYYLLMISWPRNAPRRQVCYRADKITGPYEKKVILQDNFAGFPYCGQGTIVDDANGNWYGIIFQDRGAVGRVPLLMPVRWVDGWPMLGDENGKVPLTWDIPLKTSDPKKPIVNSDGFNSPKLELMWQWNHNPNNEAWSLTQRKGYLRLKTSKIVSNIFAAPNTLSQRMTGPTSEGIVRMDISKMKDGDVAGFAAFNGQSALLSVKMIGKKKYLMMTEDEVNLTDDTKAITSVNEKEISKIEIKDHIIYLRINADFNIGKDIAVFSFSTDGKEWKSIGEPYKMRYDFRKLFMGSRFAIYNYATKSTGGFVDVDYFDYK